MFKNVRFCRRWSERKDTAIDPADVQVFLALGGVTGIDPGEVLRALTQAHYNHIAASLLLERAAEV